MLVGSLGCGGAWVEPPQPRELPPLSSPSAAPSEVTPVSAPPVSLTGRISNWHRDEVVVATDPTNTVVAVGAQGTLFWVLEKPVGPFGPGVQLNIAEVAVADVDLGYVVLTITADAGPVLFNGERVNVMQDGATVRLALRP